MQILHYFLGGCDLKPKRTVLTASHIVACDFMMGLDLIFDCKTSYSSFRVGNDSEPIAQPKRII